MEPTTHVDYELHDASGQQVLFAKGKEWACSNIFDEAEARTFVKDGVKLYRRTVITTFEEVV